MMASSPSTKGNFAKPSPTNSITQSQKTSSVEQITIEEMLKGVQGSDGKVYFQSINKLDIPTDNNGYSLKLKKSPRISINMGKAMAMGFYPEEQIQITLKQNTKEGKRLKQLFDENKKYKENYKVSYAWKDDKLNDYIYDEKIGDLVQYRKVGQALPDKSNN